MDPWAGYVDNLGSASVRVSSKNLFKSYDDGNIGFMW